MANPKEELDLLETFPEWIFRIERGMISAGKVFQNGEMIMVGSKSATRIRRALIALDNSRATDET